MAKVAITLAVALALAGCVDAPPVTSPGEPPPPVVGALPPERGQPVLPMGYAAGPAATGLVDPRALAFDDDGAAHVLEGGPARLTRLTPAGPVPVATGGGNGPWTGLARVDGVFYVAEAGGPLGGRVLRVGPDGGLTPVAADLPADGLVGPLAAGPGGGLLVGVASGVGAAAIPCQDARLADGRAVAGRVPCTGSVLRIDPRGGPAELHSWGYSRPAALAVTPEGALLVVDAIPAPDPGRPRLAAGDVLWRGEAGVRYGWPDQAGQLALADPQSAGYPNPPPPPVATLGGDVRALAVTGQAAFGGAAQAFSGRGDGTITFTSLASGVTVPFAANLGAPAALAFHPRDGALWVADGSTGVVWRIVALGGGSSTSPGNMP